MNEMPLVREKNLIVQDLTDEVLIYDQVSHRVCHLEPAVAFVWRSCKDRAPVVTVSDLLERKFKAPSGEAFLALALAQLDRHNLLRQPVANRAKAQAA
jgi:hypothetical protein